MNPLLCPLAEAAGRIPNATALVSPSQEGTFRELDRWVSQCAGRLGDLGLAPGDRLATAIPTSAEYVILLLAVIRLGATACPISTRLPEEGLARAVATLSPFGLVLPSGRALDGTKVFRCGDLVGGGGAAFEGGREIDPEQHSTIVFTSGSSGSPKAAVHAYGNHYFNAQASNRNIPVEPGDRWLLSLPLYHVAGLGVLFRCLLGGGAIAVPEPAEDVEGALRCYDVTHASLVSTQLYRLLQQDAAPSAGLKAILLGGSSMPSALVRQAAARGFPVFTSYGMTEMATQVATTPPGAWSGAGTVAARPLIEGSVSISGEGEILVRGATLFKGYFENDELELPLTGDGWFATGDLGRLDESGGLYVTGRKDNLFISGGENIQPEEIEGRLCEVDGILEALVVPVHDDEYGHRPVAFVRTAVEGPIDFEAIVNLLKEKLARFKVPSSIHPWPREFQDSGMKLNRQTFLDLAETLRGNAGEVNR